MRQRRRLVKEDVAFKGTDINPASIGSHDATLVGGKMRRRVAVIYSLAAGIKGVGLDHVRACRYDARSIVAKRSKQRRGIQSVASQRSPGRRIRIEKVAAGIADQVVTEGR